jgi:hypothetical protein
LKFTESARIFCAGLAVAVLTACGGGGGGGVAQQIPAGPPVTVQGVVNYERVAVNTTTGALNYSSISTLPVRGATVELVSGSSVLATGQTNASGQFSITNAPGSVTMVVRVRAELKQTTGAAQWDVTVRDNTAANALYTMQSVEFNSGTGRTQNLTASSGWSSTGVNTGARVAAPFAILDTIFESQQKILAVSPNAVFPLLKTFWSINNNTSSTDFSAGDIGTSFFNELPTGAGVISERQMYILGRVNDDTDEYDTSVVAHEWGHYYQSAFSRDDSTGGRHGGADDRLDRRIAFSEGWGNAWSGIVLNRTNYSDSSGSNQAGGFTLSLNSGHNVGAGSINGPKGWFREQSIQYIIWQLNQQAGFQGIHQALTSNAFVSGVPLTDIHAFSSAYRTLASTTQTSALNTLLASESISSTADAFGSTESNDGGNAVSLPYYRQITTLGSPITLSGGQTLCTTADYANFRNSTSANDGDRNKHGHFVYARFNVSSAISRTIVITGSPSGGVDTDYQLYRAGQLVSTAQTGVNATESKLESLPVGDYILVIYDYNKASPGNTCYTVSFNP